MPDPDRAGSTKNVRNALLISNTIAAIIEVWKSRGYRLVTCTHIAEDPNRLRTAENPTAMSPVDQGDIDVSIRQTPQGRVGCSRREKWQGAASASVAVGVFLFAFAAGSPACFCQTYTTTFAGIENPLSEEGRWSNNGLDWTTIRKSNGLACSTQSGTETGKFAYNDSYALLSGFPPDQEAWGEARITKPNSKCNQEVEILLRFSSSPRNTTGYECLARCTDDSSSYLEIVRWDGPLGKFTYLSRNNGKGFGLKNGDTLNASIVGNVITVFINGVKKAEATDYTFKTGNPGIGEFLACRNAQGLGTNAEFGFASFTARGIGPASREQAPAAPASAPLLYCYSYWGHPHSGIWETWMDGPVFALSASSFSISWAPFVSTISLFRQAMRVLRRPKERIDLRYVDDPSSWRTRHPLF